DIVPQSQHAGKIIRLVALLDRSDRSIDAPPAIAGALPMRRLDGFAEGRELEGERAIAVQGKRGAVEHELVLPADLVDIDQRHAAPGHPRPRAVETKPLRVTGIG